KARVVGLDERIDDLVVRRGDRGLDAAPGPGRQPLGGLVGELLPALAAVDGREEAAAARRVGPVAAGAEGPALAAEIPETGEGEGGGLRIQRDPRAAGRPVRALQDERPGLAAVGGLVEAAVGAVRPELARHAGVDDVAVLRMDENPHDALGLLEAHVGPGLAAVGGLVDAVADRDRVPG